MIEPCAQATLDNSVSPMADAKRSLSHFEPGKIFQTEARFAWENCSHLWKKRDPPCMSTCLLDSHALGTLTWQTPNPMCVFSCFHAVHQKDSALDIYLPRLRADLRMTSARPLVTKARLPEKDKSERLFKKNVEYFLDYDLGQTAHEQPESTSHGMKTTKNRRCIFTKTI
jgi:hypothetical protein